MQGAEGVGEGDGEGEGPKRGETSIHCILSSLHLTPFTTQTFEVFQSPDVVSFNNFEYFYDSSLLLFSLHILFYIDLVKPVAVKLSGADEQDPSTWPGSKPIAPHMSDVFLLLGKQ